MDELHAFLAANQLPGALLFAKVSGSRSHNTHTPDSDWDFSGVFIEPTRRVLGLENPVSVVHHNGIEASPVSPNDKCVDYCFYEVGKFCRLLMVGNPNILEMLFTDHMYISNPRWDTLVANRRLFLTRRAVGNYIGYANNQISRFKANKSLHTSGGKSNEKWLYHIVRLIDDASAIAHGYEPRPWKDTGSVAHNHLMRIRAGQVTADSVIANGEKELDSLADFLRSGDCTLELDANFNFLDKWLIDLRLSQLQFEV